MPVKVMVCLAVLGGIALGVGYCLLHGAHWWRQRRAEKKVQSHSESIWRHAEKNALPVELVRAVIRAESGGDPRAVSSSGAKGLMQIMPAAETDALQRLNIPKGDLFDPDYNVRIGTTYLRMLVDRFDGDLWLALAGNHMGPTRVQRTVDANPGRSGRELIEEFAPLVTVRYCQNILGDRPARLPVGRSRPTQ